MYLQFKLDRILRFYKYLGKINFKSIDLNRKEELDRLVKKYYTLFHSQTIGLGTLMTMTAEKLTTSYKCYGLLNKEEAAYFYINIVDPNLLFLEAYESANRTFEVKQLCLDNFEIYDKYLILLEKEFNKYFMIYDKDELWSRDQIKKQFV